MMSFAAIMVIVACHPERTDCIDRPVAVIDYADANLCRADLPEKLRRLEGYALKMYGDCIPVAPSLLAGKTGIRSIMGARELQALKSQGGSQKQVQAVALDNNRF
ncbi:hypothetical protein [Agrobacterium vitis]|uniref:hypothetical protein n=1 Tax=Agrobacterium vitis TaxID=373 RepID=UPI0012E95578|nr:hypothetical protein [Agrobacterium vitis]MUZ65231.1 hypothetical protein [Agrobacterium vitis]MVA63457.1 hypothetical protein [Agrobacterium vitis]MVA73869.1 hypothetical protein [Agrobacterium vitis]BCH58168.1 hypothetical protein RvVAR0630_07920 [Agrobacterium vitis]